MRTWRNHLLIVAIILLGCGATRGEEEKPENKALDWRLFTEAHAALASCLREDEVLVPLDILEKAEVGDHFETINPDLPDKGNAHGMPEARMFHSVAGNDSSDGGDVSYGEPDGGGRRLMVPRRNAELSRAVMKCMREQSSPKNIPSLTEAQTQSLANAIRALGAEKFEDRERASKSIVELGIGCITALEATLKSEHDAEVNARIKAVLCKLRLLAALGQFRTEHPPPKLDDRYTEEAGGFSLQPPAGWKPFKAAGVKYHAWGGPPDKGFVPNIVVVDDTAPGGLEDRARAFAEGMEQDDTIKTVNQAVKLDSGSRAFKAVKIQTVREMKMRQVIFYINWDVAKYIVVCTGRAEDGDALDAVFEASVKTLRPAPKGEAEAPDLVNGRRLETAGGFSYEPPKDWKILEYPGLKYKAFTNPKLDSSSMIMIDDDEYAGTLDEYVAESLKKRSEEHKDFKKLSQTDIELKSGQHAVKITGTINSTRGFKLRQRFYVMPGSDGKILRATCMTRDDDEDNDKLDQSFDDCVKTIRIEKH